MVTYNALKKLYKLDKDDFLSILWGIGPRGAYKSIANSIHHTSNPLSFVVSKNTRVFISDSAEIEIDSAFIFGILMSSPSSYWLGGSTINISNDAILNVSNSSSVTRIGPRSILNIDGEFHMGGSSYMHMDAHITAQDCVKIGNGCAIARGFSVRDADIHDLKVDENTINDPEPVEIMDNVWIGTNVSVKKGVTIGKGSVIASDSVVTKDVPKNTLAAGVPAEIIKEKVSWTT